MIVGNSFVIIAMIVAVAFIAVVTVVFAKKKQMAASPSSVDNASEETSPTAVDETKAEIVEIRIAQLPATTLLNENNMSEITNRTVISRISELISVASQAATRTMVNNAQNTFKTSDLVKLDIPFSKLTKSKEVAESARGYVHGGRGVAAQANLTKVDMTKVTKATTLANGVANVMNVGSLVVGQYYMTEINAKLEKMNDIINKINDFQNRERKSRIISLIALVEKYSGFSSEIIENDELRLRTLGILENLEGNAAELLGQVNIEITDISKENPKPSYQEYQDKTDDFSVLVEYQNVLVAVLGEISELTHLLGKGSISNEMRYSTFNKFLEQSVIARNALEQWHSKQIEALKIDVDKNRKLKNRFAALPGIVNESWKYQSLTQGLAEKINNQSKTTPISSNKQKDFFEADVEIIIRDGKYYYLHDGGQDNILTVAEE
jgi:hypothetical protein